MDRKMVTELKKKVAHLLVTGKRFLLAIRPSGIKYDEKNAVFRFDMDRKMVRELKKAVAVQLTKTPKVRLAARPDGIKFDEANARVRFDMNKWNGLRIGDKCRFPAHSSHDYCITTRINDDRGGKSLDEVVEHHYDTVAAFVELRGTFQGSKIKVIDIFCVLASVTEEKIYGVSQCGFITGEEISNTPIALFWAQGLEKVPS